MVKIKMRYEFKNITPSGEILPNCVNRAISLATGVDYHKVEEKLELVSALLECSKLCVCCYEFLLNEVFRLKELEDKEISIKDFAENHKEGIYLLRVDGHISCLMDNVLYDLFDCSDEIITKCWKVE